MGVPIYGKVNICHLYYYDFGTDGLPFENVHTYGDSHYVLLAALVVIENSKIDSTCVGPVQSCPPHWPQRVCVPPLPLGTVVVLIRVVVPVLVDSITRVVVLVELLLPLVTLMTAMSCEPREKDTLVPLPDRPL